MAGLVEVGGGLLLALGAATPLGAALVASVMIVAAVIAHVKNGFFVDQRRLRIQPRARRRRLAIAFTGPGLWSVDALAGFDTGGVARGVAALGIALAGATLQLAGRRLPAPATTTA